MKCPRCGAINAATAERCDCGYRFADASIVPSNIPTVSGARLQKVGCSVAIVAGLLSLLVNRVLEATGMLLLGVVSDLLMVVVFLAFAAWVIGSLRKRKAGN